MRIGIIGAGTQEARKEHEKSRMRVEAKGNYPAVAPSLPPAGENT